MAEEKTSAEERAREKSFNASPRAINKVTLAVAAFFILVIIIGALLIGGFFTLGLDRTNPGAAGNNESRADP